MTRKEKIEKIHQLQFDRVLRELQPVSFNYRDTEYWHYEVLDFSKLPEEFHEEYKKLGEIRW